MCRDHSSDKRSLSSSSFNAARSIVCVETIEVDGYTSRSFPFQCRTQHCMCRDNETRSPLCPHGVSMPHAALCVSRHYAELATLVVAVVSMPHAALCVSRRFSRSQLSFGVHVSMPHAALCVSRPRSWARTALLDDSFNAARSIVCVETLCPAALVPRGLRRHFGKTRFFAPFLASADELCPEKWGRHRRCPLCSAGCTVLERRNGGMRLCARAGALSISFSSYLMIAHASFFFNDVFASMQRGR